MENPRPFTHTAFIFKREGKRPNQGRWLECGVARDEKDGTVNVYLDRLPVGGFSGRVHLAKRGTTPGLPEPAPQRPGQAEGDEEAEG
jgi:hypothetical protein